MIGIRGSLVVWDFLFQPPVEGMYIYFFQGAMFVSGIRGRGDVLMFTILPYWPHQHHLIDDGMWAGCCNSFPASKAPSLQPCQQGPKCSATTLCCCNCHAALPVSRTECLGICLNWRMDRKSFPWCRKPAFHSNWCILSSVVANLQPAVTFEVHFDRHAEVGNVYSCAWAIYGTTRLQLSRAVMTCIPRM
jgi:hypothetical protein